MTRVGKRQHQKRISTPDTWPIARKGTVWVPKIRPGAHSKEYGMPLLIFLRDVLGIAKSKKEATFILNSNEVIVDGKVRRDERLPVGHMDIVEIKSLEKAFRIQLHTSNKLIAKEVSGDELSYKVCKVTGKRNIRGGHTQISLHDGRNIILQKGDDRIGEIRNQYSIKISVPEQEILEIYPLEEGSRAMVVEGHHQGKIGKILHIEKRFGPKASEVLFEDEKGDEEFRTALDYVHIISPDLELLR